MYMPTHTHTNTHARDRTHVLCVCVYVRSFVRADRTVLSAVVPRSRRHMRLRARAQSKRGTLKYTTLLFSMHARTRTFVESRNIVACLECRLRRMCVCPRMSM